MGPTNDVATSVGRRRTIGRRGADEVGQGGDAVSDVGVRQHRVLDGAAEAGRVEAWGPRLGVGGVPVSARMEADHGGRRGQRDSSSAAPSSLSGARWPGARATTCTSPRTSYT